MIGTLSLILLLLMMLIGGERGAISVIALFGNIVILSVAIFFLATGLSPIIVVPAVSLLSGRLTLTKQNGRNAKTSAALLSTLVIMLVMTPFIALFMRSAAGGGFHELRLIEEDIDLYFKQSLNIPMLQIFVSITILSALGAVLDTTLSVASVVYEVYRHNPQDTRRDLFSSGMRVGKDIIGTTTNTLLFAYMADTLLLAAYLHQREIGLAYILNSRFLFQAVTVMLFGQLACVLAVPTASFFIAKRLKEGDKNDSGKRKTE